MADLQASLSGIVPFIAYFITAIVMLLIFMKIYTVMTPHDEMALIKENNVAASVVFSAAFLGFSLPLASAAAVLVWPSDTSSTSSASTRGTTCCARRCA